MPPISSEEATVTGVTKFWMVYCVGGGEPTVRHNEREVAEREARRLSMANKGNVFTVLEVVDAFYMPPNQPHRLPIIEQIPF